LRDRMEVLRIPGYTEEEKVEIAKQHLVPRQRDEHGLKDKQVEFTDDAIRSIVNDYTREAGVRNLDREIANLCRKVARSIVEGHEGETIVNPEKVQELLGPVRFYRELSERTDRSGVVIGLAWTQFGGEILFVESSMMRGKGKVSITGRLGDVMKESAMAALTWIRSNTERIKLDEKLFERTDFHIHIPAGAIPKDGPSAGIALTCSLVSLLTGLPVSPELAMTGEVTLRGKVLPVGGIKEKVIAAKSAGIKHVILPTRNEKDLDDVSESVREALSFRFVDDVDQVLEMVFGEGLKNRPVVESRREDEGEETEDSVAFVLRNQSDDSVADPGTVKN